MKKNKASLSLHLFQLMCSGPVSLLWSRPLGGKQRAAVSQAPCGCSISPHLAQLGPRRVQQGGGRSCIIHVYTNVYQFNTRRSKGPHIETCCVLFTCVWVFMELNTQHGADINKGKRWELLTSFGVTSGCEWMQDQRMVFITTK